MNASLRQLATDIALLISGFGFIAGMAIVVLMSLGRCLAPLAKPLPDVALGMLAGVPVWAATMALRVWVMLA